MTLDLGVDANTAVLLLTGWTDYAFSSDNVAAHQAGIAMRPPLLQVRDGTGAWRTIIEDIGFPVGRPQTIAVDLRGLVPGGSREVRIVTNMRVYLGSDSRGYQRRIIGHPRDSQRSERRRSRVARVLDARFWRRP